MANASAKNRIKKNEWRLKLLLLCIATANLFYGAVRFGIHRKTFSKLTIALWAVMFLLEAFPFAFLFSVSRPTKDATSELVDGGMDICGTGIVEYCNDFILVTAVVHILASFSDKMILLLLAIPVFALYYVVTNFVLSGSKSPSDQTLRPDSMLSRKERRVMERQNKKKGVTVN